jgi:hypothetical protein
MVGQTLRGEYRYYRCRAAFAGAKHERCLTRYVHADALEAAIRQKISDLLADERLILAEYEYRAETLNGGGEQQKEREREIEHLDRQRLRLLKLYQMGEIDDAYLEAELASLRAKREKLQNGAEDEPIPLPPPTAEDLRRACERVRAWIECADGDDLLLLLEALQIRISAETEQAEVEGVLPMYAPACSDTDVRSMVINKHC